MPSKVPFRRGDVNVLTEMVLVRGRVVAAPDYFGSHRAKGGGVCRGFAGAAHPGGR